jgi:hypothetical protein
VDPEPQLCIRSNEIMPFIYYSVNLFVIQSCIRLKSKTNVYRSILHLMLEEFEDTKGTIRIRISKKNRQHNGQKKKYKRKNNDLQNIHIKLKIE